MSQRLHKAVPGQGELRLPGSVAARLLRPHGSAKPLGSDRKGSPGSSTCKGRRVTNAEEVASQPLSEPPGGSGS